MFPPDGYCDEEIQMNARRRFAGGIAFVAGLIAAILAVPSTALAARASDTDGQIAKVGNFQATDFPAGWRVTPHKKSTTNLNSCPALKKALGKSRGTKTADSNSDDFDRGNERFSSSVVMLRTEDPARRAFQALASRDMLRCVTRLVEDGLKSSDANKGFEVKVATATATGMGSFGDESSNIGLKITLTKGISVDVFADFVFVRAGRSLGMYSHVNDKGASTCDQLSSSDCVGFNDLLTTATNRLTTAIGGQPRT
jgi:hypothetical protein